MSDYSVAGRDFQIIEPSSHVGEEQIAALERAIGARLPEQLRQYYRYWNGGLPFPIDLGDSDSVWIRIQWDPGHMLSKKFAATPLQELFAINGNSSVDFLGLWKTFRPRIPRGTICFARDPGSNLFLIGTEGEAHGKIFFSSQIARKENASDWSDVAFVAMTFDDFLLALRPEPPRGQPLDDWIRTQYP